MEPFKRQNIDEKLFPSSPPIQEVRRTADPFRDTDGPTPEFSANNGYFPDRRGMSMSPNYSNPLPNWNTAYQPVDQTQEGEKRPGFDRQTTQNTIRSRLSSISTSKILSPLLTKSWHHGRDKAFGENESSVRRFSKGRQARKTFIHGLVQFIPPVIFSTIIAVILFVYDRKTIITHAEKYTFNSLVLGLTLLLGFAVQSTFKLYADLMRWRFLAHTYWDVKTFERIMGSSSQRTVLKLLWSGRRRTSWIPSRVQIVCFVYLFFAVGLQVVIACLGLCYSVETAPSDFAWARGNITVVDMSVVTQQELPDDLVGIESFVLQSGAANTYGLVSQQLGAIQNPTLDVQRAKSNTIFFDEKSTRFWYNFNNACSEPNCDVVHSTERTVSANATCRKYRVLSGGTADSQLVSFTLSAEPEPASEDIIQFDFKGGLAAGATTYASDMDETCGPRCTLTYALNVGNLDANSTAQNFPSVFVCENTITQVRKIPSDVDSTPLQLPDQQARIIAGAIGFSGTYYPPDDSWQRRSYPYNTYWSWNFNDTDDSTTPAGVATRIMRYSMGAVAAMDLTGPRVATIGMEPRRAQTVTVKWDWTAVVLVSVPGIQFLFLFFVMWFTHGVIIRDGSYLGNARLLRPVVQALGDKGCMLNGEEISEALEGVEIAYGVRMPQNVGPVTNMAGHEIRSAEVGAGPTMHLDILYKEEPVMQDGINGWKPGMSMLQGRYDGLQETKRE